MDSGKIGQLILTLRKEKGLTQNQIAEQLHISNKTVSKWECGQGCPDISLWDALCAMLGADLRGLLQGELAQSRPDVGKIHRSRFYVCPTCGSMLTSTGDASISCCGRALSALTPTPCTEEHTPTITESDMEYYIEFPHEMRKEHYIAFVAYVHTDRIHFQRLYPEQSAALRLPMLPRAGSLYAYCTQHGLQKCALRITPA